MFLSRDTRRGEAGIVDVAFTDRHGGVSTPPFASLDLGEPGVGREAEHEANFALLAQAFGVQGFSTMRQVHGRAACIVGSSTTAVPTCDALVTDADDVALCVRAADCVPVVLADSDAGVVAVVHAGRQSVVAGVLASALSTMRTLGAQRVEAWIGPYVCGGCYEVPPQLRAEVAAVSASAFANTRWGTPSVDLGAAVASQLTTAGCVVNDVSRCTRESADLYSYRRDGEESGRSAGLVVLRGRSRG
ncbi:MAG: laccase domain-containing protein [Propionibacteriales bacterium]|nr:laccase domain-containing protein [Propionibacteriales bacterium]